MRRLSLSTSDSASFTGFIRGLRGMSLFSVSALRRSHRCGKIIDGKEYSTGSGVQISAVVLNLDSIFRISLFEIDLSGLPEKRPVSYTH